MPRTVIRDRSLQTQSSGQNDSRSHAQIYSEGRLSLPLRSSTFDSERYPYGKSTRNRASLNDKMRGRFEDILAGPKQTSNPASTLKEWREERALRLGQAAEEDQKRDRGPREEEEPVLYNILSGRQPSRAANAIGMPSPRRAAHPSPAQHLEELVRHVLRVPLTAPKASDDDDTGWLKIPRRRPNTTSLLHKTKDYSLDNQTSSSSSGTWVEAPNHFLPDATSTPTHTNVDRSPGRYRQIAPLSGVLKKPSTVSFGEPSRLSDLASTTAPRPTFRSLPSHSDLSLQTSHYVSSPNSGARRTTIGFPDIHLDRRSAMIEDRQHVPQQSPYFTRDEYAETRHPHHVPLGSAEYGRVHHPQVYPTLPISDQFHTPPGQSLPAVPEFVDHHPRRRRESTTSSSDEYDTRMSRKRPRHHRHRSKPRKHRRVRRGRSRYGRHSRRRCCPSETSSPSSCCSSSSSAYDSSSPSPSASPVPRLMGVTDGAFANYSKPKPKPLTPKRTLPGRKARYAYQVGPARSPRPTEEVATEPTQAQDQGMPSTQSTEELIQEFSDHSQDTLENETDENSQVALVEARAAQMMAKAEERQLRQGRRVRFDLPTIEEDDEEGEVDETVRDQRFTKLQTPAPNMVPETHGSDADVDAEDDDADTDDGWADEAGAKFFGDGGQLGFRMWRDQY